MKIYLCSLLALSAVVGLAVPCVYAANSQEFELRITVIDPGATADIQTHIAVSKPFEYSETRNNAKITIKGKLSAAEKGSYHLQLTLAEWKDAKTNSTENYEVDLTPGKPEKRGFVSSFVFHRIILLTSVADEH